MPWKTTVVWRSPVNRVAGSWAVVSISDDGPGVADADLEKVFEPFYSRKETGTGLGLSISKKIVESYGGKLDIEASRLGWAPVSRCGCRCPLQTYAICSVSSAGQLCQDNTHG